MMGGGGHGQSAYGRLAHRGEGTGAAAQGCETSRGTHPGAGARWEPLQMPGRGRTGVWAAPLTAHRAWHGWLQRPPALLARPYLRPTAHTHCACAPPHAGLDSGGNTGAHLARAAAVSLLRPTRPLRIGGSRPELGQDRAETGEAGDASLRTAAPRNACREQWFQCWLRPRRTPTLEVQRLGEMEQTGLGIPPVRRPTPQPAQGCRLCNYSYFVLHL